MPAPARSRGWQSDAARARSAERRPYRRRRRADAGKRAHWSSIAGNRRPRQHPGQPPASRLNALWVCCPGMRRLKRAAILPARSLHSGARVAVDIITEGKLDDFRFPPGHGTLCRSVLLQKQDRCTPSRTGCVTAGQHPVKSATGNMAPASPQRRRGCGDFFGIERMAGRGAQHVAAEAAGVQGVGIASLDARGRPAGGRPPTDPSACPDHAEQCCYAATLTSPATAARPPRRWHA